MTKDNYSELSDFAHTAAETLLKLDPETDEFHAECAKLLNQACDLADDVWDLVSISTLWLTDYNISMRPVKIEEAFNRFMLRVMPTALKYGDLPKSHPDCQIWEDKAYRFRANCTREESAKRPAPKA